MTLKVTESESVQKTLAQLAEVYRQLDQSSLPQLAQIYHPQVVLTPLKPSRRVAPHRLLPVTNQLRRVIFQRH